MTPLVMIPGMMCDARLFAPQIAAFSGRRTLVFAPITGRASLEDLAKDVLANAPKRFALAGLSMGGIVAMEVLRQEPERIERIALMDTNPLAEANQIKARRLPQMIKVRDGALGSVMRDEMKPHYLSDTPQRESILNICMEMALDLGPSVFLEQSHALMDRPDQSGTLRSVEVPALILCGREDALCPVSRHELMAQLIPNAQLEIIEGAGHLPTLEQPDLTNAALTRWLEA
ncbi:alpha/beta fold hydrolase [Pseudopelagicola sp. nBUS_19]|uniref:alpha/beta fold hydrolase n=1 Tax=unclassified Pseudopelagicola TaxID=2649563 RepID=UPI003EB8EEDA